MTDILLRAGCFIFIIFLGYILRRIGFFKKEDFNVLSKIVVSITLTATVVYSYSGKDIDLSMLSLIFLGLGYGLVCMMGGFFVNLRRGKDEQAFAMVNTAGVNIGNFTLPFLQSFLGPMGIITAGLFDIGNASVCLGTSCGFAAVVKEGSGFSVRRVLRSLLRSVPFICYVVMLALNLLNIKLPDPVLECAGIISSANAFLAMLMIGVGFEISGDRSRMGSIVRILSVRYALASAMALTCYFLLPFELEIRQALVLLSFGPIAGAAPAFTAELKSDVGLASAVNSVSIVCSIVIIVVLSVVIL